MPASPDDVDDIDLNGRLLQEDVAGVGRDDDTGHRTPYGDDVAQASAPCRCLKWNRMGGRSRKYICETYLPHAVGADRGDPPGDHVRDLL
jgi:hypothetical protein